MSKAKRVNKKIETPKLVVDKNRHEVFYGGEKIELYPKEYQVFNFIRDANKSVTRREMSKAIWGHEVHGATRLIDQHVCRIRRKFPVPVIETDSNYGYKFALDLVKNPGTLMKK